MRIPYSSDDREKAPEQLRGLIACSTDGRLLRPRRLCLALHYVAVRVVCLERSRHGVALVMSDGAQRSDGLPGPQDAGIGSSLGYDAVSSHGKDASRNRVATRELDGRALAVGRDRQDKCRRYAILGTDHGLGVPGARRPRGLLCGGCGDEPHHGGDGPAKLTEHWCSLMRG